MIFCVYGEDERQKCLIELLISKGIRVLPTDKAGLADVVVFPTPLRKERTLFNELAVSGYKGQVFAGAISSEEKDIGKDLRLYDYAENEEFAQLNALPSAEGALLCIMLRQNKVLQGSEIAILGYGRIAKHLARMLLSLGCKVSVLARREETRAEAEAFGYKVYNYDALTELLPFVDVLVNMVPSIVVGIKELEYANKDIYLLDLASSPGGISISEAEKLGLSVEWAPGLPAKYSPFTAAEYVFRTIDNILRGKICTIKE